jgi:hypothetical protein
MDTQRTHVCTFQRTFYFSCVWQNLAIFMNGVHLSREPISILLKWFVLREVRTWDTFQHLYTTLLKPRYMRICGFVYIRNDTSFLIYAKIITLTNPFDYQMKRRDLRREYKMISQTKARRQFRSSAFSFLSVPLFPFFCLLTSVSSLLSLLFSSDLSTIYVGMSAIARDVCMNAFWTLIISHPTENPWSISIHAIFSIRIPESHVISTWLNANWFPAN